MSDVTYHLDQDLDEFSFVARFDSWEYFAGGATEHSLLLLWRQSLKLSAREASLLDISVLSNNVELLGDWNSGLFGVTSDHDNIDSGGLAVLDSFLHLWSDWVLDADVAKERQATL